MLGPLLYICTDPGIPLFGHKGASTHVREMARAMAEQGQSVCLAVSGPTEGVPADFPCDIVRLPSPTGRRWRWLGFDARLWVGECLARRRLAELIRRLRPRYIYERYSLYGTAGDCLAPRHGIPRVVEVNALLSEEASTRLHFPSRARAAERRVLSRAPALAAISGVMREQLTARLGIDPGRVFVSPMGIDPRRFHLGVAPDPEAVRLGVARATGGAGDDAGRVFVIGYVGSFNHYHRPAWLLDAAAALRERGIRAVFVVIGGPAEKVDRHREEARRRGVEGDFRYLGEVDHDRLPGWLACFDLSVVPGASPQSSPTKIVEAAAMGVAQIVPDTAPIRYLLEGAGEETYFPPDDAGAFLERVAGALGCLEKRRREARDGAARAAERHGWPRRAREALDRLAAQVREDRGGGENRKLTEKWGDRSGKMYYPYTRYLGGGRPFGDETVPAGCCVGFFAGVFHQSLDKGSDAEIGNGST